MSDPHAVVHPDASPVKTATVIGVGLVSLALFAIGSLWAVEIERDAEKKIYARAPAHIPGALHKEENGIVDFVPFDLNTWREKDREASNKTLHTPAWVDRNAGTVRLPIDRAMELVLTDKFEATPVPAPAPASVPGKGTPRVAPRKAPEKKK